MAMASFVSHNGGPSSSVYHSHKQKHFDRCEAPSKASFALSSNYASSAKLVLKPSLDFKRSSSSSSSLLPPTPNHLLVRAKADGKPLKLIISGAPASGKGSQCDLIVQKFGLVHISAGDLLRAEVAAGTESGVKAKEYMNKGQLVPDEIVVTMVKERLGKPDASNKGWLLDGYPRSASQSDALEAAGIQPDLFILLDVPDGILVERVIGRRLDPVTGKIYHLKYLPPENEEIAARLTQRFDDTEAKVKLRLQTHYANVEAVLSRYENITRKVDGNRPKAEVFKDIENMIAKELAVDSQEIGTQAAAVGN